MNLEFRVEFDQFGKIEFKGVYFGCLMFRVECFVKYDRVTWNERLVMRYLI